MLLDDYLETVIRVLQTLQEAEIGLYEIPIFQNMTIELVYIVGEYLIK